MAAARAEVHDEVQQPSTVGGDKVAPPAVISYEEEVRVHLSRRREERSSTGGAAAHIIPAVAPSQVCRSSLPCMATLCDGKGRRRDRIRRFYRSSHQKVLQAGLDLSIGSMNSRGLNWRLVAHTEKLRDVVEFSRRLRLDISVLTELHGSGSSRIVVEEYLLIVHGRVGVLLGPAARVAHEAAM